MLYAAAYVSLMWLGIGNIMLFVVAHCLFVLVSIAFYRASFLRSQRSVLAFNFVFRVMFSLEFPVIFFQCSVQS